jgi:ubiquinone/menaquinone biosynthesis C-methylase UbiE
MEHLEAVAEAFSRKALVYDEFGEGHPNLARLRRKVREHVLDFLKPGDRILELNAGTGADAAFFASHGFSVHATDISPGMVSQIRGKIEGQGLQDRLTVQQCSFLALEEVHGGPFDVIFSNMGGVNCVADLRPIASGVQGLLKPGGYVTWVVMPHICPWELAQLLRLDWHAATRRLKPGGVLANVEGVRFMTYYYTPRQVAHAFGVDFHPCRLQGLSVFTPPADRKDFAVRHPYLYTALRALDERMADRAPFNRWGDFFILTQQYKPQDR